MDNITALFLVDFVMNTNRETKMHKTFQKWYKLFENPKTDIIIK